MPSVNDSRAGIVTLTTDFGLQDTYVGQMKGVLLKTCRTISIIDITHEIPVFDILAAAVAIRTSYACFPAGTVHLVVVDPGVGGERGILAAAGGGHFFIAPDNGSLSLLMEDAVIETVHWVDAKRFTGSSACAIFQGRDIMAPVAATLAGGVDLDTCGPAVGRDDLVQVRIPEVTVTADTLKAPVLRIDHFGNIRTALNTWSGQFSFRTVIGIEVHGRRIERLAKCYGEVGPGELLALVDSAGFLEIAANQANAARLLGVRPGDQITVYLVSRQ